MFFCLISGYYDTKNIFENFKTKKLTKIYHQIRNKQIKLLENRTPSKKVIFWFQLIFFLIKFVNNNKKIAQKTT